MPCSCSSNRTYVAHRPDGSEMPYRTESEAAADVLRNGGSYSAQ